MPDKTWTDRAIDAAPQLLTWTAVGLFFVFGLQAKTARTSEDFERFQTETRQTLTEIRADTRGLSVMQAQITALTSWQQQQQGYNGSVDGRLNTLERKVDVLSSQVGDIVAASKQVFRK